MSPLIKFKHIAVIYPVLFLSMTLCRLEAAGEFPDTRQKEEDLFPRPPDGYVAKINPPVFVWLPVKNAAKYRVILSRGQDKENYVMTVEGESVLAPGQVFSPGRYTWTVEAYDSRERLLATRSPFTLIIPEGLPEFPFPDLKSRILTISQEHPRLIFQKKDLPEIRKTLKTTRREAWAAVKKVAEESMNLSVPVPPWYGPIEDYKTRRLEYRKYYHYIRPFIDEGLPALSMAWLMTGDKKYAEPAIRILLEVSKWDASGITSSNRIGFDEPGLSLARCMHSAYDWLYDAMTPEQRGIIRSACIERARDTFVRVGVDRPFLVRPGSSHDGRLIGYLCEQAIVLFHEAPPEESERWLEYSLKAFYTVFPHWGGEDGGWAEGIGYGATYNIKSTHWIESCLAALDLDLWQKPFFQKVREYFFYCSRPNDEFWPFGDGAERGPANENSRARILHVLMRHYAQRFQDPACQWWAENVSIDKNDIESPVIPLILGKEIKAQKPVLAKNAKVFEDIGWCAFHSDISNLEKDVFFLFKSSPYGSISHSHADQNSFYISVGGRALAIPSGYYGPMYDMPHHAEWTRISKANNTVLVNGEGQTVRDFRANGFIQEFQEGNRVSYVSGNAASAYENLNKFERHVMYVRPGLFLILDDLESPEPADFQWMLHSLEPMKLNKEEQSVRIGHEGAWMNTRLFNSSGRNMEFSETDQFDTPYNAGIDSAYQLDVPNHSHFQAGTTGKEKRLRIAAFIVAGAGKKEPSAEWLDLGNWKGLRVREKKGVAEVWAQLVPGTLPPKVAGQDIKTSDNVVMIGIWKPSDGGIEVIYGPGRQ